MFFHRIQYYFDKVLRLGEAAGARSATVVSLGMAAGMPLGGWLSGVLERMFGARARGWIAAGGMIAGAGLAVLGVQAAAPGPIVAWLALAMGAVGLSESLFWITAVERAGRRGGTAAGILNTGGNVVGLIAPVLTPWVGERYGWPAAIGVASLVVWLGSACWFGIGWPQRELPESE
jgi:MFS family permease